ncbi:hypothetical protein HK100_007104 [Physocladia obscura]|uniref:Uncharacterized protein n=1 Tax=Physocladia obscura TaxID=109957 RepID=A0AAD5SQR1_9FUNG|nr:hypothetical protein HK100_007104 [Physocladia obscura]
MQRVKNAFSITKGNKGRRVGVETGGGDGGGNANGGDAAEDRQQPAEDARALALRAVSVTRDTAVRTAVAYSEFDVRRERATVRVAASGGVQTGVALAVVVLTVGPCAALNHVGTTGGAWLEGATALYVAQACVLAFGVLGGLVGGLVANVFGPRVAASYGGAAYACLVGAQAYLYRAANRASLRAGSGKFAVFGAAAAALGVGVLAAGVAPALLTFPSERRRGGVVALALLAVTLPDIAAAAYNVVSAWLLASADVAPSNVPVKEAPSLAALVCLLLTLVSLVPALFLLRPSKVRVLRFSRDSQPGHHNHNHEYEQDQEEEEFQDAAAPPPPSLLLMLRSEFHHAGLILRSKSLGLLAACVVPLAYYGGSVAIFGPTSASAYANSQRALSLSTLIYLVVYVIGATFAGVTILDNTRHPRQRRARMASAILLVLLIVSLVFSFISSVTIYGSYAIYGLFDGFMHAYFLWLLGATTNNPYKQARTVGFLYAIYYLVITFKYILELNVQNTTKYDNRVSIGLTLITLIMLGSVNFHCVSDTCDYDSKDDDELNPVLHAAKYSSSNINNNANNSVESNLENGTMGTTSTSDSTLKGTSQNKSAFGF